MHAANDATLVQLDLIGEIASTLDREGIAWWLFGGWATDFHAGEITRDHADIEAFIWSDDSGRARDALVGAGFAAPPAQHPDEGQPFMKYEQEVGLWYLERAGDGTIHTPGRWADWPWLPRSFDGHRLSLRGTGAPVMSIAGLLDIKENFARHPHGASLREKDHADIALLRGLIAPE